MSPFLLEYYTVTEFDIHTAKPAEIKKQLEANGVKYDPKANGDVLRRQLMRILGIPVPAIVEKDSEMQNVRKGEKKRIKILIHKTKEDKQPVPVAINGFTWLIKRGHEVAVPIEVIEALRHAIRTELDEETMEYIEVPSYPFQVLGEVNV